MFQDNKHGNVFKSLNQNFKIVKFKVDDTILPNGNVNRLYDFDIEYKGRFGTKQTTRFQVKSFNDNLLKPEFQVVPPDNLNEEEDDWDFTAGPEWNETELVVGDYITPEMWKENWWGIESYPGFKIVKFKVSKTTLPNGNVNTSNFFVLEYKDRSGKLKRASYNVKHFNDNFLKPNFKITPPKLNEQDEDEFSQEFIAGPEWNVKDLNVGDIVTPDMWDQEKIKNISISIIRDKGWFLRPHKITRFRQTYLDFVIFDNNKELSLNFVKDFLKPTFKINFNGLNEQDEDEWDFEAGPEWGVKELGVGDTIIGDMWDWEKITNWNNQLSGDNPEALNKLIDWWKNIYDEGVTINLIKDDYDPYVQVKSDSVNWVISLKTINNLLSPEYKLLKPLTEQDEDEWDLEAGAEWNEYDGTVVITYILEDEGFIYLQEDDLEDFESLNPGALNKFDYNYEPIRETNIYRSKPIYIRDLISKLDELVGVQAQPYTEEKTTKGFKDWMADNGIVIDSLAYLYDTLSPTTIKTSYSDEYGNPVKITPKMKDRIDYNDDGMFYGGVIDVKFNDKLTESDDEWDLEAGPEWNEKEIKVGDYWYESSNPEWNGVWSNYYNIPDRISDLVLKVIYIGPHKEEFLNQPYDIPNYYGEYVIISKRNGKFWAFTVDYFNNNFGKRLNAYVPTDNLNEQDDEWDLEAGPEWNETLLSLGDKITPDMWDEKAVIAADEEDEFLNNETWVINMIESGYMEIKSDGFGFLLWDIADVQALLKPQYRIVVNKDLFEEEDEWDFEAGDEWNVRELTTGDTITPNMWKDPEWDYFTKRGNVKIEDIGDEDGVKYVILTDFKEEDNWEEYDLNYINNMLKYPYQIVLPLHEQEEDEWDLEAGPEWNVTELGIGDTITSNMWNKNLSPEYGNIGDWIDNPAEDQIIDGIDTDDHGVVGIWFTGKKSNIQNIYTLMDFNNLLDPKYRIIPPLNESEEDDWDFEAGDEWNVQELTTGDIITPDMWNNDLPDEWYDEFQGWEMEINDFRNDNKIVVLLGPGTYYLELEDINNYLEPKYQVIPPLTESEDDEWDLEAGEEWNTKELTTGDYITPDMWDWQEIGAFIDRMNDGDHEEYRRDWEEWEEGTKNPIKILKIHGSGVSTYPELDSYIFRWGPNIRFINTMLKPEFKVIST
jgi:hypothetical protein